MEHLEIELKFFEDHRAEWLNHHRGKFALIKGQEIAGFFDSRESAFAIGATRWGNVPFLIKEVSEDDRVDQAPALFCGVLNADF